MTVRLLCRARAAALALALLSIVATTESHAQTTPQAAGPAADAPAGPDYSTWDAAADAAETALADPEVANETLETLRTEIVARRQEFEAAQTINAARIATLREQVGALGEPPAEGATEAPEIADRRAVLNEQLEQLQVPGLTAGEAYRRADGIVREIDRILRERQADELLRLWPSPLNPVNWPPAVRVVSDSMMSVRNEVTTALGRDSARSTLTGRLPVLLVIGVIGLGLILRAPQVMDRLTRWLKSVVAPRWLMVILPLVSFGKIVLPLLGLLLALVSVQGTGLLGQSGQAALGGLAIAGIVTLVAKWLGSKVFPKDDTAPVAMRLSPERRAEGRFLAAILGLLVGIEAFRKAIYAARTGEAEASVLAFPPLVLAGIFLFRMGQLFRRHLANVEATGLAPTFMDRMLGLLGQAAMAIGVVGPVLAAVGYIPAALAIVYPAVVTLGIVAVVHILQGLVEDVYGALTGRPDPEGRALAPVLIGFLLAFGALPVLALVWGARVEYLAELWATFLRGFSIGETRISPSAFAVLAVVFAIGFMATRLFQAALRSSVLPRTKLDQGGQTAVVSGIGYIGIFIAGLVAVHAAGINLAGLAIVAGALSLGIGFGLKNIVENFVSGIILLVERPVSEGDWIEVGGLQGTVKAISVRSTRIQTFDRSDVIVPNADLVSGRVTNFTRFNLSGRLIVPVSVAYGSDSRHVERVLREVVQAEPLAQLNPVPMILFMGFGADALNFEVRMIISDVNFSLSVQSEMNHEIFRRFREEGIEIPFPQREVWLRGPGTVAPVVPAGPVSPASRSALGRAEAVQHADSDSDGDGDSTDR